VEPVIHRAPGDTRKATSSAIPSGFPVAGNARISREFIGGLVQHGDLRQLGETDCAPTSVEGVALNAWSRAADGGHGPLTIAQGP